MNETNPETNPLLPKTPTGIEGLDEVTHGGLPRGRATLVSGNAGAGKTVLSMEFLINGVLKYDEPGVFMSFEESGTDLAANVASFGYDLRELQRQRKLIVDPVLFDRSSHGETGAYSLDGLFLRLGSAVKEIGAKRVVLDTIEVLFSALDNQVAVRGELLRLFRWLKDKGLTAIVTAERAEGKLTRYGLEEYVADCVIFLDHRVSEELSTRRLRILKYRGSLHEADEQPFLMGKGGISVFPLTSAGLSHLVSEERISSGVSDLDKMLGGKGFFRGSSILVSGTAGTGKSSLAFTFLKAACERGEPALYFSFEESSAQSVRNMKSIGMDLGALVGKGLLNFITKRPSSFGLEAHLAAIHSAIRTHKPKVVVLDPISVFVTIADRDPVKSMLTRLVDFLKTEQITALFTHVSSELSRLETMEQRVSSIMDTWLLLRDEEQEGRRRASLFVLKSRGMAHSREVREFVLTDEGIRLRTNAPLTTASASAQA
jgi:circadian clock protein KaiC